MGDDPRWASHLFHFERIKRCDSTSSRQALLAKQAYFAELFEQLFSFDKRTIDHQNEVGDSFLSNIIPPHEKFTSQTRLLFSAGKDKGYLNLGSSAEKKFTRIA